MKIFITILSIQNTQCMKIKTIHKISITSVTKMTVKVVHLMASINRLIIIITFLQASQTKDNSVTSIA
jgi:hypothetical protein